MKLATYVDAQGPEKVGAVLGDDLLDLAAAAARAGAPADFGSMLQLIEAGPAALDRARGLIAGRDAADLTPLAAVRLRAPLPRPVQMRDFMSFERHLQQGIAQNVRDSVKSAPDPEQAFQDLVAAGATALPAVWYEQPVYYKCNRLSVVGHEAEVLWPSYCNNLDYELEIAAVIGVQGRDIPRERAHEYIFGFTIYNDMSARDAQFHEMGGRLGPAKGKDFDTGNILGPWIVTADELDPYACTMLARVNGKEFSRGHSSEMHHRWDAILAHVSKDETLYPGEVLGSGTVGNGCGAEFGRYLSPGDVLELEIEGIGILRNRIVRR